jgi:polyisoprenoid-binding protein YceI
MNHFSILKAAVVVLGLTSAVTAFAEPVAYRIDDSHSFANFSIRHVASKTSGTFSDVTGKIVIDDKDLSKSSINAVINMLSINTSNAKRDQHIQKDEYLNTSKFATMQFESTKIESSNNKEGVVTGNFTMHGVTKKISIPFKLLGFGSDPWGGYRLGLEGKTTIKASDYGYGWATGANAPVGDEVEVTLLIEGVKQQEDKKMVK